jgi:pyridinium-3,5-bisthiocarboxylic acid mononucleotide nickel chelatase
MMIAILDPFSGISGDMTLGALVDAGLDAQWLEALPERLGIEAVRVRIREVLRGEIACVKVDFDIPPQPHGRHIREIREMVARAGLPDRVARLSDEAFTLIAEQEGAIHGMPAEQVHLHEVGAVDAILDVVGSVWGLEQLGVTRVFCGPVQLGDGTVRAAHGVLPVPAPATLRILEGVVVRPGPEGAGELVTPTGAALVRVLSDGPPPSHFVPRRSGFGAGTKDFRDRANALRLILADEWPVAGGASGDRRDVVQLAADMDDMAPEYVAALSERLRAAGALDVVLVPVLMKKGRPGTRVEVICAGPEADALETLLLVHGSSIGVRRQQWSRRELPRREVTVEVAGHPVRVKVVTLPDGAARAKPEFEDVERVALATGRTAADIFQAAQGLANGPQRNAAGQGG